MYFVSGMRTMLKWGELLFAKKKKKEISLSRQVFVAANEISHSSLFQVLEKLFMYLWCETHIPSGKSNLWNIEIPQKFACIQYSLRCGTHWLTLKDSKPCNVLTLSECHQTISNQIRKPSYVQIWLLFLACAQETICVVLAHVTTISICHLSDIEFYMLAYTDGCVI